jgi:hypothetical protein
LVFFEFVVRHRSVLFVLQFCLILLGFCSVWDFVRLCSLMLFMLFSFVGFFVLFVIFQVVCAGVKTLPRKLVPGAGPELRTLGPLQESPRSILGSSELHSGCRWVDPVPGAGLDLAVRCGSAVCVPGSRTCKFSRE